MMDSINLTNKNQKTSNYMHNKKQIKFESPDLRDLQAVVINDKTTIYIKRGTNVEEARNRYLSRFDKKAVLLS